MDGSIGDYHFNGSAKLQDEELMPAWGYTASAVVLFVIGILGFFLNLMVIILMCKDKQLRTPMNMILFNLVCSDFSVSILGNPFTLVSALNHRWMFGNTMCIMYGFFMSLLGITSITTLTVLSFERYVMVSRPLSSRRLTMRGAIGSIFFIWSYSLAVTTPPLFGWGKYVNEAANISCSINWEEQTFNALTYIVFLFLTGLVLPVIIICFSYINIITTMKKNTSRMGSVSKMESRVTMMVLLMIVMFMVAWTPYSVFALMEQFAPIGLITPAMGVIPALVAKSSICYDPVIYVGMNSQFMASVNRIFRKERDQYTRGLHNTGASADKTNENVTMEYLNPNNIMVSVTIYQEEESFNGSELERRMKNYNKKVTLAKKLSSKN
ncbi:vertebrate ancient opsin-like [Arctopsyche grandis]|uniref:vertebrate ancient opsin-like n=1 Tax=Arctopsyche grandis TaxID=121162 RepID=UPI00406D8E0B